MSDLGARHLGEVVTTVPGSARVLESFGLDYCCGGGRSLAAACAEHGVDPDDVIRELHGLVGGAAHDWATLGPVQMVDHLQSTHHAYLHTELPRLDALAEKVASVHGARHPELMDVLAAVRELRDDLEPHLLKEERILFPLIRELVAEVTAGSVTTPLGGPVRVMRLEHDRAGALLAQLRHHAGDFEPPHDACASYRALYDGLAQLEADTHLHVHKENNVLFPALEALGG